MTLTRILLLGASGSIGASTLDVVRQHADRFSLVGLSCGKRYEQLLNAVREFRPEVACICDKDASIA